MQILRRHQPFPIKVPINTILYCTKLLIVPFSFGFHGESRPDESYYETWHNVDLANRELSISELKNFSLPQVAIFIKLLAFSPRISVSLKIR